MFFDGIFGRDSMALLERVTAFTENRHKVLANNIANLETPNYRAKDLSEKDFQKVLDRAINEKTLKGMRFESTGSIRVDENGRLQAQPIKNRHRDVLRHDRNNVSLDGEMVRMAKNAMKHQAALQLLRQKYLVLGKAIRGRSS